MITYHENNVAAAAAAAAAAADDDDDGDGVSEYEDADEDDDDHIYDFEDDTIMVSIFLPFFFSRGESEENVPTFTFDFL